MKVPVQAPPQMQANLERERTMEPLQIPVPQHVQPRIPVDHSLPQASTQTGPPASHPHPFQWGFQGFEQQRAQWEQDRERLMSKAQDTMSGMSEATLESLSGTIETLRAKLAEHRAQREKQQKLLEQELEEKKKNPPRWV